VVCLNISRKKRLRVSLFVGFFVFFMLIVRVGFIQFVNGEELQAKAYIQQTLNTNDTLFDPTMQEMSLKIGQLRILKSEGKISEEEFMFHLNNILEDKE